MLRVNTVSQSTRTFVNLQQIKQTWLPLTFKLICPMDLSNCIFGTLANSVDPDRTPKNAACLFIYSAGFFFLFCKLTSNKTNLTPLKFKTILFKDIWRNLQAAQIQIRRSRTPSLIRVTTICLMNRNLCKCMKKKVWHYLKKLNTSKLGTLETLANSVNSDQTPQNELSV